MFTLVHADRITCLDALIERSQGIPPPHHWTEWGEPVTAHVMCICGRAEVRPGEALCPICDGPE